MKGLNFQTIEECGFSTVQNTLQISQIDISFNIVSAILFPSASPGNDSLSRGCRLLREVVRLLGMSTLKDDQSNPQMHI
jgi:hypothetical protein